MAPFSIWPVAFLSLAVLFYYQEKSHRIISCSYAFGFGLFLTGSSWIYVSIHDYGHASAPLAAFLMLVFFAGMALMFSLPYILYTRFLIKQERHWLTLPGLFIFSEWIRYWLLTGFPWLYVGYGQLESPLSGWLPVTGALGTGLVTAVCASAAVKLSTQHRALMLLPILILFGFGIVLSGVEWTKPSGQSASIGIIQPNFSLEDRWNPANRKQIRQDMLELTDSLQGKDIIFWPEAAIPEIYLEDDWLYRSLNERGRNEQTTLITGVPTQSAEGRFHNSVIALGNGSGMYHKSRLVPFGEYVPLEKLLRGMIQFFNLPMSNFHKGATRQSVLHAGNLSFIPFVCYEVVYGDLVASYASDTDFLVTLSNDAWFGRSIGPLQHLEIARVRARETGRYMVRGTNNGVSAIIDPAGNLVRASGQFERQILQGTIHAYTGTTPYARTGSLPVVLLCIMFILVSPRFPGFSVRSNT
jgi:apolipoprotein N-acyltransferase